MADYPSRNSHFAHQVIRLMTRICAAQEIGTDAAWLVAVIAHTEDAKRYRAPVTFWNEQLQSVFGGDWKKLDRARRRAVGGGWLHYEPGGKGKVGRYWVTIPPALEGFAATAVDEDDPTILSSLAGACGEENAGSLSQTEETSGEESGDIPPDLEGEGGDKWRKKRGTSGDLSSLNLNQENLRLSCRARKRRRLVFTDDDLGVARYIWRGVQRVFPEEREPSFDSWANEIRLMRERDKRTHEAIRRLFDWANQDDFWRKNIRSPSKLRKQWGQLAGRRDDELRKGGRHATQPSPGSKHDPQRPVRPL